MLSLTYQGPIAEVTVAPKPYQGTHPKMRGNHFRGSFFGSFLDKQKRINQHHYQTYCHPPQ